MTQATTLTMGLVPQRLILQHEQTSFLLPDYPENISFGCPGRVCLASLQSFPSRTPYSMRDVLLAAVNKVSDLLVGMPQFLQAIETVSPAHRAVLCDDEQLSFVWTVAPALRGSSVHLRHLLVFSGFRQSLHASSLLSDLMAVAMLEHLLCGITGAVPGVAEIISVRTELDAKWLHQISRQEDVWGTYSPPVEARDLWHGDADTEQLRQDFSMWAMENKPCMGLQTAFFKHVVCPIWERAQGSRQKVHYGQMPKCWEEVLRESV